MPSCPIIIAGNKISVHRVFTPNDPTVNVAACTATSSVAELFTGIVTPVVPVVTASSSQVDVVASYTTLDDAASGQNVLTIDVAGPMDGSYEQWFEVVGRADTITPAPPPGSGIDVLWVGPNPPPDPDIELWWDTDEPGVGPVLGFASNLETVGGVVADKAVSPAGLAYERPYIDVRTYGAVGDGVTDDMAAINAAIAAAAGGTVYFPKGVYKLAPSGVSVLTSPPAGTTFRGVAAADSVISIAPTTTTAREVVVINADDVTFADLTLRRASTFDSVMFRLSAGVDRFTLTDCVLDGADAAYPIGYTHGVAMPETGTVTRVRAERCRFTSFHFAWLQTNTSTATIIDIQIRDCEITDWIGEALSFNAPVGVNRDVVVDGCRFTSSAVGGNGLSFAHVENARVSNCYFNHPREAIHIEDYSRDIAISNNTIYECGSTGSAFEILDSNHVTIDGNTFRNSTLTAGARVVEVLGATSGTTVGGRNKVNATYAVTFSNNIVYAGPNTGVAIFHVAQGAVVGNTITGGLAIDAAFAETGVNALNGVYVQPSIQIGCRIAGNSIRGFRYGIAPATLNTLTMQPGTVVADNSITECRYGIVANNTKTATYSGNIIHRCIWPFTTSPTGGGASGGGNDPHTIVGNVFQGNQYPAAFDGVLPVVANGAATVGAGVTLTVQPLIADLVAVSRVITFSGGGVLTTTGGIVAAGSTSITGNLTTANIASGEVGYIFGGVDIPYTTPFTVNNRSVWANVDSNRDVYTSNRVGFYRTAPIVKAAVSAAATDAATTQTLANALRTALINLGLVS